MVKGNIHIYLFFLLMLPISVLRGQEIYYYGVNSKPVDNEKDALSLKEVSKKSRETYILTTKSITEDGWERESRQRIRARDSSQLLILETRPDRLFPRKLSREIHMADSGRYFFKDLYKDEVIREGFSSRFLPLHLEGKLTEYYPGGQIKSVSLFQNNQLMDNENWLSDGSPYVNSLFYSVDRLPEFEYGVQFFNSYLMQKLSKSGFDLSQVDDRVVVGWVIMETGAIESPIALEGNSTRLKEILTGIISEMPGVWKPAILNAEPVRYFITLPLNFSHRSVSFQNLETSSGILIYDKF